MKPPAKATTEMIGNGFSKNTAASVMGADKEDFHHRLARIIVMNFSAMIFHHY